MRGGARASPRFPERPPGRCFWTLRGAVAQQDSTHDPLAIALPGIGIVEGGVLEQTLSVSPAAICSRRT